jgi:double-stranded uracil-DNA glycosylase
MPSNREVLPDYLARYQRVVFVGTAAGNDSARLGHYYAGPGNAFWELLYGAGFTTSRLEPREDAWVLVDRIGLTDLCKHHHGMDSALPTDGYDIGNFVAKIEKHAPDWVAFTSKAAARTAAKLLGRSVDSVRLGPQPDWQIGRSRVFVLPSPSGANRGRTGLEGRASRLEWYSELRDHAWPQAALPLGPGRALCSELLDGLRFGHLRPLLAATLRDTTLDLEFRGNAFNVYYRGGSLVSVSRNPSTGELACQFDPEYTDTTHSRGRAPKKGRPKAVMDLPRSKLDTLDAVAAWVDVFPRLKGAMDVYFGNPSHPKEERQYSQETVRSNNFGCACDKTDYVMADLEYKAACAWEDPCEGPVKKDMYFDLVGAYWPSTAASRRSPDRLRLAIIEVKYRDIALQGEHGLVEHMRDVVRWFGPEKVAALRAEMLAVLRQKHYLGLISSPKPPTGFDSGRVEYLVLLADHDPGSRILHNVLSQVERDRPLAGPDGVDVVDLRFCTGTFMGYGIWGEGLKTLGELRSGYDRQICSSSS